jgi:exopolysaccharide biosynthesis protein
VKDTYSFGPVLVKDGQVNPDMKDHLIYKTIGKSRNERCSIGMVEPGHYFCVISRNVSYDDVAQIHMELGSKFAYNLDGGNSAAMVFMGEQVNMKVYDESLKTGQRSILDLLCIGTSDDVPGVKDKVKGTK